MTTFRPGHSHINKTGFIIVTRRGSDVPSAKLTEAAVKDILEGGVSDGWFTKAERMNATADKMLFV